MRASSSLTKSNVIQLLHAEGDIVQGLLAWTLRQPRRQVIGISGGVWEEMTSFLKERLDELPPKISKETIFYLYSSQEAKDWMLYSIIMWIISCKYKPNSLNEQENKNWVISHFRGVQLKRLLSLPAVFQLIRKNGRITGIKAVKRKRK